MKKLIVLLVIAMLATPALAQPWYVRGEMNGWGTGNELTWDGSRYAGAAAIPALDADGYFEFKVANADWSTSFPPDNIKTKFVPNSSMNFYFYSGAATDSAEWFPRNDRVGYDSADTGWQVIGDINGESWGVGHDMTDMGNGLYQLDLLIANAGTYNFKFRGTNDWEISVGAHFGRFAPNATFDAWGANEIHRFELDLPHGRARVIYLPEPATLAMMLIAGLALIRRR